MAEEQQAKVWVHSVRRELEWSSGYAGGFVIGLATDIS